MFFLFSQPVNAAGNAKLISKAQAEQIALQKLRNGRIESSALPNSGGKQLWTVSIPRREIIPVMTSCAVAKTDRTMFAHLI